MNIYRVLAFLVYILGIGFTGIWVFNHAPYPFLGILIAFAIPVLVIKFIKDIPND
jgi:hypothetical protein